MVSVKKALVVDDSAVVRKVVASRLTQLGLAVIEDERATAFAEVDLAVLDLELPDGDGVAIALRLRAAKPDLPVAFFSSGSELIEKARALGPVFHKPDELEALIAWVNSR
jgi:two-component system OmpR family response regulator